MSDLWTRVERELAPTRPPAMDVAGIIATGRRVRRRRVAATIAAFLVPGLALALVLTTTPAPKAPEPTATPTQPSFALPPIDGHYMWQPWTITDQGEFTAATRRLDDALRDAPDLAGARPERDGKPIAEGAGTMVRQTQYLFPLTNGSRIPVHGKSLNVTRPQYHGRMALDAGHGFHDLVTVDIVPRGSFLKGPGDISELGMINDGYAPHLVDGCDDYTGVQPLTWESTRTDYECTPLTTPQGEEALQVTRTRTYTDGTPVERAIVLVVYRADGNALVLETRLTRDDGGPDLSGGKPRLTGEALMRVASALPLVMVV